MYLSRNRSADDKRQTSKAKQNQLKNVEKTWQGKILEETSGVCFTKTSGLLKASCSSDPKKIQRKETVTNTMCHF